MMSSNESYINADFEYSVSEYSIHKKFSYFTTFSYLKLLFIGQINIQN